MNSYSGLYVFLVFLAAAVPYVWMGLYAWRKRPAVAVTPFAWLMLCMSVWSLGYGLEILFPTVPFMLWAIKVEYIAVASVPVFLFFFTLEFTGKSHWLASVRTRVLLWMLPVVTMILIWTNEYHGLVWNVRGVLQTNQLLLLNLEYRSLFWLFASYSFLLVLGSVLLLAVEMIQRPGEYRIMVNLIALGILAPLAANFFAALKLDMLSNIDITPILALPASLGLSWAITRRYRLLELLPLEYLSVLKNMKDAVIIVNMQKRVVYLNPVAEALLGRSESDAIGQPLNYVSSLYGEKLIAQIGGEQRVEMSFEDGGRIYVFEVTVSPVSAEHVIRVGEPDFMIVLHDITHLKETENALSRRESIMSALSLAAGQLLKEATWEHKIPAVLEKIGLAAGISRVLVSMNYTDHNGYVYSSLCYEWASADTPSQLHNPNLQHVPLRKAGMERWEKILSSGEPIFGLVKNLPEVEQKFLTDIGSLSIAVMPVFVKNQWWGFIMFEECRHERQWTSTDIEALSIAANMFGSAEERARTEQKLLRRQKSLDMLHEIVLASLKAEDLMIMSQDLVQKFSTLISADRCSLALWDEVSRQEVQLAVHHRGQNNTRPLALSPAEHTFTELVLNSGHTLVVEEANTSFFKDHNLSQTFPAGSVLALPLLAGRKKLGSIVISFDNPHRFQSEEISICEQASNLVALALEKFQTVEEAERRAHASETLRKASVAITETLETGEAVARILEQLKQVIAYDSASVQLLHGDHLEIIGGSGFENMKDVIGMSFPIPGDNPNTVVIQSGKPYLLAELSDVYQIFLNPPHNHIHSWLGVPLIFQERIIGLLAIDSAESNHFTEEDINLATMFANQVAVTLENARIFKETQDQAITDPLTGVYNRRGMFQIGDFELLRARRTNHPFSLLMFDIDYFKRVNDRYGHLAGDQILRGLAERVHSNLRSLDLICRYGGEEFVVFLPDTSLEPALMIAERMRQAVMNVPFATDSGPLRVTISIGIAQAHERDSLKSLIERADQGLYAAKRTGRNRVMMHDEGQPLSQT